MPLSRRQFLVWSSVTGLLGQSRRLLAALSFKPSLNVGYLRCLKAWVDTILPEDADSPTASALGVHFRIADKAVSSPTYHELVKLGCRWLDQQARGHGKELFADLDERSKETLVGQAENSVQESLPWVFFQQTREDAFHFYYAHPESWIMLKYPGPPQPYGFRDYAQPPGG
jgi:hypothetical protein